MSARTGTLHSIPGQPPMVGAFPTGCRFHPRCPYVGEACRHQEVALQQVSANQQARCLRAGQLTLGVGAAEGAT